VYLTPEEERILAGEYGEGMRKAMEILVAIGKIYDAERLIPISSAQISGVSYHNIGDAGLEFLWDFSRGARVRVKATLNPGGVDLGKWREMKIDREFMEKQGEVIKIFMSMGVEPTLTCTPYLVGNLPKKGEHIAWSESSAVAYANSVLGAYTNRESGISALAAAIIGKTPMYGLHLKENRRPEVRVVLKTELNYRSDYSVLGYAIASKAGHSIPYIEGMGKADLEALKLFAASIATYAGAAIFHIKGVTAEWMDFEPPGETIEITSRDLEEGYEYLRDEFREVDMVWIGCPHTSLKELEEIAGLLKDKEVAAELWITTSRQVKRMAEELGYIETIEKSGAKVIIDTCVAVAPLLGKFKTLVTNSAKAFYYSRGVNRFRVKVANLEKCIDAAVRGEWV
jgi:hypothetical protein